MRITRRHMLAAGAAVAAAGAASVGVTLHGWWTAPADAPHAVLSQDEAAFLVALACALYPAGGEPAAGGDEVDADRFVDAVLLAMPAFQVHGIKLLIHALDNAAILQDLCRFSELPRDRAESRVWEWLQGPLAEQRSAVQSLALLVGMAYATHPLVAPHFSRWTGCGYGR